MSDFADLLETEIPKLRRYARALTRDPVRADDLVQNCLVRAIAKQHLWQPGTNLRAWLFAILHNQHVNDVRRSVRDGDAVPVDQVAPTLATVSDPTAALQIRDLERAMAALPLGQRQVILLVGLEGMRYEEVAAILRVPVGTVRSRLSRGRETLRRLMNVRGTADDDASAELLDPSVSKGAGASNDGRAGHLGRSHTDLHRAVRASALRAIGSSAVGARPIGPIAPRAPGATSARIRSLCRVGIALGRVTATRDAPGGTAVARLPTADHRIGRVGR
jgi:RNA polymerase sigma-70 factor, ECF subfamily